MPDFVRTVIDYGVTGRAADKGLLELVCWNPRDYTQDVHRTVDDRPYGGGPGMLMKYQPLRDAVVDARAAGDARRKVIYLSPQGRRIDQAGLQAVAASPGCVLIAGRYEGIDERLIEAHVDEEWSLGDYVLSGGELAAMVVIDALARLLPDALGDAESAMQDSFVDGLLDCPHYTRPEHVDGQSVPAVLLSGDHQAIARWRRMQALGRTWLRRPDLLQGRNLSVEDERLLDAFREDHRQKGSPSTAGDGILE